MKLPRAVPPKKYVYVVANRRTLFGLHRPDTHGTCRSYILGFKDPTHARALATSLEKYHNTHGTFPPTDVPVEDMNLPGGLDSVVLKKVHVQRMELDELVHDLRGTDIRVSVLNHVDDSPEGLKFTWNDVEADRGIQTTIDRLRHIFDKSPSLPQTVELKMALTVRAKGPVVHMYDQLMLTVFALEAAVFIKLIPFLL